MDYMGGCQNDGPLLGPLFTLDSKKLERGCRELHRVPLKVFGVIQGRCRVVVNII